MFLAETVFQSMDGTLSWILTVLAFLFFLVLVAAAVLESKISRLIRIQRATYDLIKAMAEQKVEQKTNAASVGKTHLPSPPLPTPGQSEGATAPDVYRID